ncbi:hypothetical protein E2C01_046604 [Portunus trituberculatus]|uniref:Uncharacterized protein n=1 Tax=Portunus trituberculatus TaxID=210409 RepID=A0A5B7G6L8_PORTR|nr:hypothetical protein [Portunus trituberculatus]
MSTEYKTDERIIKDIIQHHIKPTDEEHTISLTIYYIKKKSQLLIKNKTTMKNPSLQENHVIYKHTCKIEDCGPQTYIGMTQTTL